MIDKFKQILYIFSFLMMVTFFIMAFAVMDKSIISGLVCFGIAMVLGKTLDLIG